MTTKRIGTLAALGFALWGPIACADGGATGPVEPPPGEPGPPVPEPDFISTVTVAAWFADVVGSCDHDNIFESSSDGEFELSVVVTPSGAAPRRIYFTPHRVLAERGTGWDLGPETARTTFTRNVTRGETFSVEFKATEFDGILGADGQLDGLRLTREHRFVNGWVVDPSVGVETLAITGAKERCGITLMYGVS